MNVYIHKMKIDNTSFEIIQPFLSKCNCNNSVFFPIGSSFRDSPARPTITVYRAVAMPKIPAKIGQRFAWTGIEGIGTEDCCMASTAVTAGTLSIVVH